jgi:ABC-type branched-subunit amino acid transport system substrate-binding protein
MDSVEQFNTSQQIYQIQLLIEDGKCGAKDATSATQKLLEIDKIDFLIGGFCSSETIASATIVKPYGKSLLSAVSSSSEISKLGNVLRFWSDDLL